MEWSSECVGSSVQKSACIDYSIYNSLLWLEILPEGDSILCHCTNGRTSNVLLSSYQLPSTNFTLFGSAHNRQVLQSVRYNLFLLCLFEYCGCIAAIKKIFIYVIIICIYIYIYIYILCVCVTSQFGIHPNLDWDESCYPNSEFQIGMTIPIWIGMHSKLERNIWIFIIIILNFYYFLHVTSQLETYPNPDWDSHHLILIQITMICSHNFLVILHIEVGCNVTETPQTGLGWPNSDIAQWHGQIGTS